MDRFTILEMANRFYPDGMLSNYYDSAGNFKDNRHGGDTLGRFIVLEIGDAFDEHDKNGEGFANRADVLETAKKQMHMALGDIMSVLAGLDGLVNWRGMQADYSSEPKSFIDPEGTCDCHRCTGRRPEEEEENIS